MEWEEASPELEQPSDSSMDWEEERVGVEEEELVEEDIMGTSILPVIIDNLIVLLTLECRGSIKMLLILTIYF